MTDYLKTFTEGEKIKASETNSNNQYILGQITDTTLILEAMIQTRADKDLADLSVAGQAILDAKADNDLSNVTQDALTNLLQNSQSSAFQTLASSVMPDVTAGISVNASGYTTPSAGWFYRKIGDGQREHWLAINGVTVWNSNGDEWVTDSCFIPVPKGATVTFGPGVYTNKFYPCKGV